DPGCGSGADDDRPALLAHRFAPGDIDLFPANGGFDTLHHLQRGGVRCNLPDDVLRLRAVQVELIRLRLQVVDLRLITKEYVAPQIEAERIPPPRFAQYQQIVGALENLDPVDDAGIGVGEDGGA